MAGFQFIVLTFGGRFSWYYIFKVLISKTTKYKKIWLYDKHKSEGKINLQEDGEVGINCMKLVAKYTIFAIPDNFVSR